MTVNQSRSQNADLVEGCTDGKYKKIVMDRGVAEPTTYADRRDLNDTWYGIHEARDKTLPDGTMHVSPDYVATPPARMP